MSAVTKSRQVKRREAIETKKALKGLSLAPKIRTREIKPLAFPKPKTRGQRVIAFIEKFCIVPEGDFVGDPVRLDPFQIKFILEVYDNPFITDTAILSIARKNAKTGTIAFIVLAHLVGPEAVLNSRIISGAMSQKQAGEVFNLANKCVLLSPKLSRLIHITESHKKMRGLPMNVEYEAISAEAGTAHGKSPILAILDEVGQIKGPQSDFVDAITTAQGAYQNPLLIYISTQAAKDDDFFSIQIDDALRYKPKKTVCHVYTTPVEVDPAKARAQLLDRKAWLASNPALGTFRSEKDMIKQAKKASRMASFENTFRNLNLNQRVNAVSSFIGKSLWLNCLTEKKPLLRECERIVGGLDLSGRLDLTSAVFLGLSEGHWYDYPYFWTPAVGLDEREKRDRAPYTQWVKEGHLLTTPGKTVRYRDVAREIARILGDVNPELIDELRFDAWRIELFKDALEDEGITDLPLEPCGQGFKFMSPCIESLEDLILSDSLKQDGNPVMNMCVANGAIVQDGSENRKFHKIKTSGRMDGLVALAMASGAAAVKEEDDGLGDYLKNVAVISRK